MIDMTAFRKELLETVRPLQPDRIVLFGSYADGRADDESDIDLFMFKTGLRTDEVRPYRLALQKRLLKLQKKYRIGIDLFVDSPERFSRRIREIGDQFYRDVQEKGKVLYGQ